MNRARSLAAVSWLAISALTSCNKDKDPPPPAAPAQVATAAPAAGPAAGQVRMVLVPGSRALFLINAPLEKIKGRTGGVEGTIDLDSMFLNQSKGSFSVDLDGFATNTFGDESKDSSQTEHMKNWLEIGPDVDDKVRERNRRATFTITSISDVSVNNIDNIPSSNEQRVVTMRANGDLLLHGIKSPKTIDLWLAFVGPPEEMAFLLIRTVRPFTFSLKEHDIKPRDVTGKFLAGALEKVGQKIDDTVQVSLDLKAAK